MPIGLAPISFCYACECGDARWMADFDVAWPQIDVGVSGKVVVAEK